MSYQCGATPTLPIGASLLGAVLSVLAATAATGQTLTLQEMGALTAGSSETVIYPAREVLTMDAIERRAILEALEKTGGNRTQAAELLGIGLRTLQRKLKEYRMARKDEER